MSTVTFPAITRTAVEPDGRLAAAGFRYAVRTTLLIAVLLVCAALVVVGVAVSAPLVAVAAGLVASAATTTYAFSLLPR